MLIRSIGSWELIVFFKFLCIYFCSIAVDSKTLKEEKREELFESLKAEESIGWAVDVIDPRELSAKMLKKLVSNICLSCLIMVYLLFSLTGRFLSLSELRST